MFAEDIGKYLRSLRQKAGITQRELASKIGVTHQAVSRWENGKSIPDVDTLRILGNFYGVSVDAILQIAKDENKEPFITRHKFKFIIPLIIINTLLIMYYFLFLASNIIVGVGWIALSVLFILLAKKSRMFGKVVFVLITMVIIGLFVTIPNKYYRLDEIPKIQKYEEFEYDFDSQSELYYDTFDYNGNEGVVQVSQGEDQLRLFDLYAPLEEMVTEIEYPGHRIEDVQTVGKDIYLFTIRDYEDPTTGDLYEISEVVLYNYESNEFTVIYETRGWVYLFDDMSKLMIFETDNRMLSSYIKEDDAWYVEAEMLVELYDLVWINSGYIASVCDEGVCNVMKLDYGFNIADVYFEDDVLNPVYLMKDGNMIYGTMYNSMDNTHIMYKFEDGEYIEQVMEHTMTIHHMSAPYNLIDGKIYNEFELEFNGTFVDEDYEYHYLTRAFRYQDMDFIGIEQGTLITFGYHHYEAFFMIDSTYRLAGLLFAIITTVSSLFIWRSKDE